MKIMNTLKLYGDVVDASLDRKWVVFFVYGHGGASKTFLCKAMVTRLHLVEEIVRAVASSGIETLLFPGGRMAHSGFAISVDLKENSFCEYA